MKRIGKPKLPRSRKNPIGQGRRVSRVNKAFRKYLIANRKWLLARLKSIPVEARNDAPVQTRYDYQIDLSELSAITTELSQRLDDAPRREFVEQALSAYETGTGQSVSNLSAITDDYTREITAVLSSAPYLRRSALLRGRLLEGVTGFTSETKSQVIRVLSEGIENGRNPRVVAKDITERFGVAKYRAERLARTEILQALRRGRLDESQDARETLRIQTQMLWISALSPTTRDTHRSRHGELYTQQEVREFYSTGANAINCKCAQTEILVGDDGHPVTPETVDRVRSQLN